MRLARCSTAIDRLPVPVIAQIHGAALGGGAGLAAVADITVAADDTTFGFTEVKLGLIPAVIAPYVLAKIGHSAARELLITGRQFDAAHAKAIGLVHAVVPGSRSDRHSEQVPHRDRRERSRSHAGRESAAFARSRTNAIGDAAPITAQAIADRRVSAEAQKMMKRFVEAPTTNHQPPTIIMPCKVSLFSMRAASIVICWRGVFAKLGVQSHVLPIDSNRRSTGRHRRHPDFRRTAQRHRSGVATCASIHSVDRRADPGICYGHQLLAATMPGGIVKPSYSREYGLAKLRLGAGDDPSVRGGSDNSQVWVSHGDSVEQLPDAFEVLRSN